MLANTPPWLPLLLQPDSYLANWPEEMHGYYTQFLLNNRKDQISRKIPPLPGQAEANIGRDVLSVSAALNRRTNS